MKPIINFSPPKTSTSALYFAFNNFENYQQVSIKEWVYLYLLSALGETSYSDRFAKFYGTRAHEQWWKNIYISHIKHLQYFLEHESSEYCLEQIKHTQKLIFENHSIDNYLNLFKNNSSRFLVDFDVRNHQISPNFFQGLLNKAPDLVAFCGVRPFISLLVSRIHEIFAWSVVNRSEDMMLNTIDANLISSTEYNDFIEALIVSLSIVKQYYKGMGDDLLSDSYAPFDLIEPVDKSNHYSLNSNKIDCINLSRTLIKSTDYIKIFRLLKPINYEVLYFNPARIISSLGDFQFFLNKKGVKTGNLNKNICGSRVRESSNIVIDKILSSKEIRLILYEVYECAQSYYRNNVDRNMLNIIFPEILNFQSINHSMLRTLDLRNNQVIFDPPRIS